MAVIKSQHSFDILSIDLHRLDYGFTGWDFDNNVDQRFGGEVHRDVYDISWQLPGYDYSSRYMGDDLAVSSSGALTGGTIGAYSERVWTGSDWWDLWQMTDTSMDAAALYDAIGTGSVADDRRVFRDALSGDDLFRLSINDDRAFGYRGNDTLRGDQGDDILAGQQGRDRLFGSTGDDRLVGGQGHDHLSGGAGADRFVFRSTDEIGGRAGATDVIVDFMPGTDVINLRRIDASEHLAGNNAFSWHGDGSAGTGAGGAVWYDQIDRQGSGRDVTLVRIDTDADGAAEGVIRLSGLHALGAGDFLL